MTIKRYFKHTLTHRLALLASVLLFGMISCGNNPKEEHLPPAFKSSNPENNASQVPINTEVKVMFDEVVTLAPNHGITVNNLPAAVSISFTELRFQLELEGGTSYHIQIPKGAVINTFGIALASPVEFTFSTKETHTPDSGAMQFVANMGVGWNLGNSYDTKDADPTAWGNPLPTQKLIDSIAAKGFTTLRIPVTWQYHMGAAPDYLLEPQWLQQVEKTVKQALDLQMYVIINVHHDEEWLTPTYDHLENAKNQLAKVWTQIAMHFEGYNNHLIFETLNEPRLKGSAKEWSGGTVEGRDCVNQMHAAAVSAIRATGGNNTNRYLMISPYAASSAQITIDALELPATNNLIVSVHNYFPYQFALAEDNFVTEWGSAAEKAALDNELDRVKSVFIEQGIPVVMGEWGSLHHNNLTDRTEHAAYFAQGCIERSICPVWWDNGNPNQFGIINRNTCTWVYPEIANAIGIAVSLPSGNSK